MHSLSSGSCYSVGSGTSRFGSGTLGLFKPTRTRDIIMNSIKLYRQLQSMGHDIGKDFSFLNLAFGSFDSGCGYCSCLLSLMLRFPFTMGTWCRFTGMRECEPRPDSRTHDCSQEAHGL